MIQLGLLTLLLLGSASGDTREAEKLTRRSIVEYNVGDFRSVLDDITQAYKLDPRAGLLYNLAQCHRALEHWKEAEFFYRGYLREKPSAANRPAVLALIDEMAKRRAESVAAAPVARPPPVAPAPIAPAPPPAPTILVLSPDEPRSPKPPPPPIAPTPVIAAPAPPPAAEAPVANAGPRLLQAMPTSGDFEAANEIHATQGSHSHGVGLVLGGLGLIAGGVAAVGFVQVANFNHSAASLPPGSQSYDQAKPGLLVAQGWYVAAVALAALSALGLTGAVIAW